MGMYEPDLRDSAPAGTTTSGVVNAMRLLVIGMAAAHTVAAVLSYSMNADGIAYLDIADAYVAGNWKDAINSVWSPMYSWILAPILSLVQPSMRWEFATVQIVNFFIFIFTLACFEFFWRSLTRYRTSAVRSRGNVDRLPGWIWQAVGYSLFAYCSLGLIEIWSVTPDMLMSAWVYVAAGLIVQVRMGKDSIYRFGILGALLGIAYLTKSVMLPLSVPFLLSAWLALKNRRGSFARMGVAVASLIAVALPFVVLISISTGKPTFGDAGRLTYLRYVNGIAYPHWQGGDEFGTAYNATRQLEITPPVYEFGSPVGGTYPISTDPAFWYRGSEVRFDLSNQLRAIGTSAGYYLKLLFVNLGGLTVAVLTLLFRGAWTSKVGFREFLRSASLLVPVAAALGMYAIVLVEGRYVAAFLPLLWGDLLANLTTSPQRESKWASVVTVGWLLAALIAFNVQGLIDLGIFSSTSTSRDATDAFESVEDDLSPVGASAGKPSWPGATAVALLGAGVKPGDTVGVVGHSFDSFWARLARLKIVAEIPDSEADQLWRGDDGTWARAVNAFRKAGVRAVVAEYVPPGVSMNNWTRVEESGYYFLVLDDSVDPSTPDLENPPSGSNDG